MLAACGSTNRDTENKDWAQAGMPPLAKVTAQPDEWKETEVPPPPAFDEKRLVPIEMPPHLTLKFGVDPRTIQISGDGVVRYVVVARNSRDGGFNAFYEAIRCKTEEYKTYARYTDSAWGPVANPDWKRFEKNNTHYTLALAKQGICRGHAPRASVDDMVRNLRDPIREAQ